MELIKITELTNELGMTSRTLRYYEQIGLIRSERLPFEKYRYYDRENIERIKQILVLRKMQIPVKDIIRIYESKDLTVLVDSFIARINAIDRQIDSLYELKRIINRFMESMIERGIKHISALPLLYEKMENSLKFSEREKEQEEFSFRKLSELSDRTPPDLTIVDLPSMRVLSSLKKDSDVSDVDGFWDWLGKSGIFFGTPGSRTMFEYLKDDGQTVVIHRIDRDFSNTGPFQDFDFDGGLFAVGSTYEDEDIASFHSRMIKSFDENSYYEVDFRRRGSLRHESLVESVISPDSLREKINMILLQKAHSYTRKITLMT
jgi:DNA-binding transcriptional MerR regulator